MRLAPASLKGELLAICIVLAMGLAVCLLASSGADARPSGQSPTAVVPNGTYGVYKPARGEYVVFKVRNRKVRDLEFQIRIVCQASDEPHAEERFFRAGAEAPQGRTVPANGKLIMNWRELGGGRLGNVHTELKFGVRDVANFAVIVPEDRSGLGPEDAAESCDGVGSLRFHRGFELPAGAALP